MRTTLRLVSSMALAAALAACSDSPLTIDDSQPSPLGFQPRSEQIVPGEVIVKARAGADVSAIMRDYGAGPAAVSYDVIAAAPGESRLSVVKAEVGHERELALRLSKDPRVAYAEPNYLRQLHAVDRKLWAFFNDGTLRMTFTRGGSKGQTVTSKPSKSDADEDNVETYGAGGAGVVVGSIDTGVDFNHTEFLSGQLIAGRDWVSNDNNPSDGDGHGTHTTGTMVGRTVGIAGVSGAGINVKVYVQRVCGPRGCPTTAIVNAIRAAADYPGMVAMNLSLGGPSESQAEKDAISYATSKNVLVIASAGNDGTNKVSCPACDPNAISVAATNWADQLSYYSNYGSGLDISAPGGELYSNTTSEGGIYSSVPGGYAYYQGTSMAAPQVTGTAGVVASKTGLRGSSLRSRILGTTDNIGSGFGAGRLNSYRAVTNGSLPAGQ